jgi:hypothetical protein
MTGWIVGGAWLFAVAVAVVVLGFAAYELRWKTRRLQSDVQRLQVLVVELAAVGAELRASAERRP